MIEIKSVSLDYGVKDLDLTIKKGEFLLLCGRSGCGKTTVTRLINGLIPEFYPAEMTGNVLVDGERVRDMPMYRIAERVGSVFQNPRTQFFNVDTDSEIAFGIENEARPPEELRARVEQTGRKLQIEKLRGRNIFELSGGEKQKIAFASVYAMNPEIYLLDEPSSNLDVDTIAELKQHLRLIKAQGKTVIVAEHRLYYLMDLADRIVYLEKGRITGIYTPDEFRQIPASGGIRLSEKTAGAFRNQFCRSTGRGHSGRWSQWSRQDDIFPGAVWTAQGMRRDIFLGGRAAECEKETFTFLYGHAGRQLRTVCGERGGGVLVWHQKSRSGAGGTDDAGAWYRSVKKAASQYTFRWSETACGGRGQHDLQKRTSGVR